MPASHNATAIGTVFDWNEVKNNSSSRVESLSQNLLHQRQLGSIAIAA